MHNVILFALLASICTWFITALGSAVVLFFKAPKQNILNLMLGFSAGVMIAASFWSLLQPAIERAEQTLETPAYIVVAFGFALGAIFICISDKVVSHIMHKNVRHIGCDKLKRIIVLVLSITLHNIPEGFAVGVAFGVLKENSDFSAISGAIAIAVGIGLQNFPEGAAVSLPLRREGYSRKKCIFWGQISAIVEPIAATIGAALVGIVETILPFALSFAAGAMIFVSVHELIPECQENRQQKPYMSTIGILCGFLVMMILDVMLG